MQVFKKWAILGPVGLGGLPGVWPEPFPLIVVLELPGLRMWLKTGESPFRAASVVLLLVVLFMFGLNTAFLNCRLLHELVWIVREAPELVLRLQLYRLASQSAQFALFTPCFSFWCCAVTSAGSCRVSGNASQVPATNPTSREGFSCSLSSGNVLWCQSSEEAAASS